MAEPSVVADCVAAMKAAVKIPVTVKCRIGIDEQDPRALVVCVYGRGQGRWCRRAHCPCAQGLAKRIVTEGKPRHSTARLCPRTPAESRAYGFRHRPQWRHLHFAAGENRVRAFGRRDDGACCLSGALAVARRRSADLWRPRAVHVVKRGSSGPHSLYRTRNIQGRKGSRDYSSRAGLFRAVPGARAFRRHLATEAVKPNASAAVMADALAPVLDRSTDLAHIAA